MFCFIFLLGLCKPILLCYVVSQTICITKYSENDLLFLRLFHNDLWFIVLGALRSIKIFRLQKKIVRIVIDIRSSYSCRKLFFNLEILPLPFQYILSHLLFMIKIGINLWSIVRCITLTLGNMSIFTNLP